MHYMAPATTLAVLKKQRRTTSCWSTPPSDIDLRRWATEFYAKQLRDCGLEKRELGREVREFEQVPSDLRGQALYDAVWDSALQILSRSMSSCFSGRRYLNIISLRFGLN